MRGRALTALATLLLAALALGACGDGGEDSMAAKEAGPRVAPLEVSGGGSAQFRVEGADNSIANYGFEAPRAELHEAADVAHGYFAALAREDWAGACARLTHKVFSQVAQIASSSPKVRGRGCGAGLAALLGKVSAAEAREVTVVDAASLRRKGVQGFLIYRGAGGKPYFVSLQHEGGGWAVAGLSPSALG